MPSALESRKENLFIYTISKMLEHLDLDNEQKQRR